VVKQPVKTGAFLSACTASKIAWCASV